MLLKLAGTSQGSSSSALRKSPLPQPKLTSAWTFLPGIIQQARPGIGTKELIPLPFPAAQLRMKLKLFVFNKQTTKKTQLKNRQAEKLAHPPARRKVFQHTAPQEEMQTLPCSAGLHPDLGSDCSNTAPRLGAQPQTSLSYIKPGQTGHFPFPVHPQDTTGTGAQLPTAAPGPCRSG